MSELNLTTREKSEYVQIINNLWQGTMPYNTEDNINEEVIEIVEEILSEIAICSKNFVVPHIIFSIFYGILPAGIDKNNIVVRHNQRVFFYFGLIRNLVTGVNLAISINDWIDALRGSRMYKYCIYTAIRNYRSHLQIKLMGL